MKHLADTDDLGVLEATMRAEGRLDYQRWRDALEPLLTLRGCELTPHLQAVAARFEVPLKTVQNKMSALRQGGFAALINKRKAGVKFWASKEPIGLPDADQKLLRQYCYQYENTQRGIENLRRDYRAGKVQAAARKNPHTKYPYGWSPENLGEYAPSAWELKCVRIGRGAAASTGPLTLTTRAKLWVGSHYFIDDVWQNLMVRVGARGQSGRVLELGMMDAFSASRFCWGSKPRLKDAEGKNEGLRKTNMLLCLAAGLGVHGYHAERGTVLMGELGTAKVYDEVARLLHDETVRLHGSPRIVRREPGITGREQAVLGWWAGAGGGNPRFKSPLEAFHSLMQSEFSCLPGQAGRSVPKRPEALDGMLSYTDELAKAVIAGGLSPERARKILLPILEYHSDYLPLSLALHELLNRRTEHDLEGWVEAGHMTSDYLVDEGKDLWIGQEDFLGLEPGFRSALTARAQAAPGRFDRHRKLSPREVWDRGCGALTRLRPHLICTMLAPYFSRERERVDGAYFVFEDDEIAPGRLWYEARMQTPEGVWEELRDGERFNVLVNPFAPQALFVMDCQGRYLGVAPRYERADRADLESIHRANGHQAARTVARLARVRADLQPEADAMQSMRKHNAEVLGGGPITPGEKGEARDRARRDREMAVPLEAFLDPSERSERGESMAVEKGYL